MAVNNALVWAWYVGYIVHNEQINALVSNTNIANMNVSQQSGCVQVTMTCMLNRLNALGSITNTTNMKNSKERHINIHRQPRREQHNIYQQLTFTKLLKSYFFGQLVVHDILEYMTTIGDSSITNQPTLYWYHKNCQYQIQMCFSMLWLLLLHTPHTPLKPPKNFLPV